VSADSAESPAAYRPRWFRIAFFLGTPPPLTRRQWRVLGLVSVATLFDQYDRSLFALALPKIQASLAIAEADVGYLASIVRLGSLPAFIATLAADRFGRRRVLLVTILGYTVCTGLTAIAPDTQTFVALQFLSRVFGTAEMLLAVVVIAEELDASVRGWGVGALFAIQACGVGVAAVLFPIVEWLGFGWRALYAVGLGPLLVLAYWRRSLPETERFEQARRAAAGRPAPLLGPAIELVHAYPGRFIAVASVAFIFSAGGAAADFLSPKYLLDAHGWTPGQVATLFIFGGALGIFGAAFAGRLSDRAGRKRIAVVFGVAVLTLAAAFFNLDGFWLSPIWIAMIFTLIGHDVLQNSFAAELFPTSYRSTASGARAVAGTIGGAVGLAVESPLYDLFGSHWTAVSVLLGVAFVAPLIVALAFPETAGRSLEEIAPEQH
jgi:putative MFS transporter